ncbi:unnamed protein product [Closterium sp. Yama58-4]|nr:unnamed protein product [Closterium sp. Yama58-4]
MAPVTHFYRPSHRLPRIISLASSPSHHLPRIVSLASSPSHRLPRIISLASSPSHHLPRIVSLAAGVTGGVARMATFEAYERQFTAIVDALSDGASSGRLHESPQRRIDDAESLIRQMDLEARSLPPTDRAHLLARLRAHKLALLAAKKRAAEAGGEGGVVAGGQGKGQAGAQRVGRAEEERAALLEDGRDYVPLSGAADQRARLLQVTARVEESSVRVAESRRAMAGAEQLGVAILADLHQQRQSLLRAGDTLEDVDHQMSRARRVLTGMAHKLHRNKWITALILSLLMLAIAAVIYLRLRH